MEQEFNTTDLSLTIVTAIYGYRADSIYGGRGRDIYCYNPTLVNLANLKLPIIIYTNKENVSAVETYVQPYLTNYKIIPYELLEFKYGQQIIDLRQKYLDPTSLNDRNHILCNNKLFWLNAAAKLNLFNTNKFMWIDAGLTHHGIFPEKVGGVELCTSIIPSQYYPEKSSSILNPKLATQLSRIIKPGKIFGCSLQLIGSHDIYYKAIESVFNESVSHISRHVIGGIFGGHKEDIENIVPLYESLLIYCLEQEILTLEEPIFSALYAVYPELFDIHNFTEWWYHSPNERCSGFAEEKDSFYKIFTKLYNNNN